MTPGIMNGFTDELTKEAKTKGFYKIVEQLTELVKKTRKGGGKANKVVRERLKWLKEDPRYRSSIGRGAALGGVTGAAGSLAAGGDDPALTRLLRGGIAGTVGGAGAGAVLPSWFRAKNFRLG
jgi:hypothetical protein